MKEFFQLMRRFVSPYKKFLGWAVFLNLLSAVFNIFSFTLLIPILQILFKMDNKVYEFIPWDAAGEGLKDIAVNNFYYYVTRMIEINGPSLTLLFWVCYGIHDFIENIVLFCFFRSDDSFAYGSRS